MADSSIRQQSDKISAQSVNWPMISALMTGTSAMRAAGKALLPQWPNEDEAAYKARLAQATLHAVFKRTVIINAARPFSRAIEVSEKTPKEVSDLFDDVDLQDSNLSAFASQLMEDCLSFGLTGVLVDYPKAAGVRTKADELAAGVRPYLTRYPATTILGWKLKNKELAQLRLLESVEVDDGDYGTKSVEQVRVLTPGAWAVYQPSANDANEWDLIDEGTTSLPFIPFVFFYGTRKEFGVGISPLLDLAFQNVEHYQSASDQQTILHVARVPILFAKGFGDSEITIGASTATSTENPDADLSYVEHTGASIGAGRQSLLDLEDRMRATGAELIAQKPAHVTATQVSTEGEASKSLLQQIVEVFEESLEKCLNYMAAWIGKPQTAEVEIYKDFDAMTGSDPGALISAAGKGVLSKQTLFNELKRRDFIASDRSWETEQQQMAAEQAGMTPKPGDPPAGNTD